jgi:hypothetical protein
MSLGEISFVLESLSLLLASPHSVNVQPSSADGPCSHVFLEKWDDRFVCTDCLRRGEANYTIADRVVLDREEQLAQSLGDKDTSSPQDGIHRGISIKFLVEFCKHFNLWDISTREVRRKYIIPLTCHGRCRFVDLLDVLSTNIVGRAVTFISHSWDSKFGDLISAISDAADGNRKVWIDICGVRQWPSTKPDLSFEVVIPQCTALLLYCPCIERVDSNQSPDAKSLIPFFRAWCLFELFHAATAAGVAIVMKGGRRSITGDNNLNNYEFLSDWETLWRLSQSIDINNASATKPSDRDNIFAQISRYNFNGNADEGGGGASGVSAFNYRIRGVLLGTCHVQNHPTVQSAACGDETAKAAIIANPETYFFLAAAGGYETLVRALLSTNENLVLCRDSDNGYTGLMGAALGGHRSCLELLVRSGSDVNAQSGAGSRRKTALMLAAQAGHICCLEALIAEGAELELRDENGWNALETAAVNEHAGAVSYLRSRYPTV